jgi:carboxylesterase type B
MRPRKCEIRARKIQYPALSIWQYTQRLVKAWARLRIDALERYREGFMSAAWIAFARAGNPYHSAFPVWPSYDTTIRTTMLFNDICELCNDPGKDEWLAWQRILKQFLLHRVLWT